MRTAVKFFPFILLLSLFVSCGGPASTETFLESEMKEADGSYNFSFNVTDSTDVYDILFYTKVDCTPAEFESIPDPRFVTTLVSPSGQMSFGTSGVSKTDYARREYFSIDYEFPFRSGFMPGECGLWQLRVIVSEEDRFTGFRGLGLKVTRRPVD